MIPVVPQIQQSFASLYLTEVAEPPLDGVVVCERLERVKLGQAPLQDATAIVLMQRPGAAITLSSLIARAAEELHRVGHVHVAPKAEQRSSIAAKIIAMATALCSSRCSVLETLNAVIAAVSPARVSQWAVLLSPSTGSDQYHVGNFNYGVINLEILRYRCDRAGSDFAVSYGERLRGRQSIFRETRDIRIVDVRAIQSVNSVTTSSQKCLYRIADDYFAIIANAEQRSFMADLDEAQAIFGAMGLGTISAESLRQMFTMAQWITVFDRQTRKHGWVVPTETYFTLSSTDPKALSDGQAGIRKALKLDAWQQRPLDSSLQVYSQYLTTAQEHERQGHIEESLLLRAKRNAGIPFDSVDVSGLGLDQVRVTPDEFVSVAIDCDDT